MYELKEPPTSGHLWNPGLDPTPIAKRTWRKWHIIALWIGMGVNIPVYMLGSGFISSGMNWWQAVLTVLFGGLIVIAPMTLIGHAGTKYGIPFPVFLRACFGVHGARLASLLRGLVACGWFGILTWIGSDSVYRLLQLIIPKVTNSYFLGDFLGINVVQLSCFLSLCFIQLFIIHHGMGVIKRLMSFAAPLLILMGLFLLGWAWLEVGSFKGILAASYKLHSGKPGEIWHVFWPSLTSVVGLWSTLALNMPDFTRFAHSQKDQFIGQFFGLPPVMLFYSFIGIIVTSASVLVFNQAIWNPVDLISRFHNPLIQLMAVFSLILANVSCNMAANVVSSANDFSNLFPGKISFRVGGYLTGIIGVLIFPWKLIADPNSYVFRWLIAYSALLGAVGGIMLCDYYVLRRTKLNLKALFQERGKYTYHKGWNLRAWVAFGLAILPNIPGFLVKVGLVSASRFPAQWINFYDYAWFVSLGLAFIIYWILMKLKYKQSQLEEAAL